MFLQQFKLRNGVFSNSKPIIQSNDGFNGVAKLLLNRVEEVNLRLHPNDDATNNIEK